MDRSQTSSRQDLVHSTRPIRQIHHTSQACAASTDASRLSAQTGTAISSATYILHLSPPPPPLYPTSNTRHEHGLCTQHKRPLWHNTRGPHSHHNLLSALELVPVHDMLPELLRRYMLPLARYCADTQFTPLYATQHKVRVGQHTPPLSL